MLKYVDTKIVFQEIPDEITLAINISGCPCNCEGCHSSYLAEDIGERLDFDSLNKIINDNTGVTCISFMGGDANPDNVNSLAEFIRAKYPELKIAWYSGRQELSKGINLENFDYVKLGPYRKDLGPLNSPTTNQRFYKIIHTSVPSTLLVDQTHLFWKKDSSEK